jgi:riboflavin synthase
MFTGIITDVAGIKSSEKTAEGLKISFEKPQQWSDLALGESVNTDGVCLTVAAINGDSYDCVLVPETLSKTTFGQALPAKVNLERALAANGRLGGHFVQGHADGVGTVTAVDRQDGYRLSVEFDAASRNLVIPKGSISIDGVSLTVAQVTENRLTVALVPHTLESTTLGGLKEGDKVNLEYDMVGKYIINNLKLEEN